MRSGYTARKKGGTSRHRAASHGPLTSYPFRGKTLSIREAVEFVAEVLYPRENKRDARKRVREQIRYRQRSGELPQSQPLVAMDFFTAALDLFPKWAPLRSIQGLPLTTVVSAEGMALKIELGQARVIVGLPPGADLQREYDRIFEELQDCKEEILVLKEKLANAERQLEERRNKDLEISRQRSMAGKSGGRPKISRLSGQKLRNRC